MRCVLGVTIFAASLLHAVPVVGADTTPFKAMHRTCVSVLTAAAGVPKTPSDEVMQKSLMDALRKHGIAVFSTTDDFGVCDSLVMCNVMAADMSRVKESENLYFAKVTLTVSQETVLPEVGQISAITYIRDEIAFADDAEDFYEKIAKAFVQLKSNLEIEMAKQRQ